MIIWKPHKLEQLEHLHLVNTYPFSNFNSVTVQVWEWIFVVVNFDALAQASDFQIERRQVVFLCRMQDSNPEGLWNPIFSRLNACWQTNWAIEDQAKDLNSTARPYDQQAFSPPDPTAIWYSHLALAIYIFFVVNFDALAQASDFHSKGDKLSSSAECRIRTHRVSETQSSADWMPADKPTELSRIKLKTWTRQPVPMISKHSAHLTPLPFGIRTWLWRYTYFLLLISMLWHRQAIFIRKETSCIPLLNAGFEPTGSLKPNLQQTECLLTNWLSYRGLDVITYPCWD